MYIKVQNPGVFFFFLQTQTQVLVQVQVRVYIIQQGRVIHLYVIHNIAIFFTTPFKLLYR